MTETRTSVGGRGPGFDRTVEGWRARQDELPYQLEPILQMRNPAAHDAAAGRERVRHQRSRILGIGCEELLVRVVKGTG